MSWEDIVPVLFMLFLLIVIVWIIKHIILYVKGESKRKKAVKNDELNYDGNDNKLDKYLQCIHLKLKHLNVLQNGDYVVPSRMFERISRERYSQMSLQELADHMNGFIRLSHKKIKVSVHNEEYEWDHTGEGFVFTNSSNSIKKEKKSVPNPGLYIGYKNNDCQIHLTKKAGYGTHEMIAMLAHECTHHFLFCLNIDFPEEMDNEILTDIIAVYLGFGKYLYKGYKPIVWESDKRYSNNGYTYNINTSTLGYISYDDITYLIKKVNKLRKIDKELRRKEEEEKIRQEEDIELQYNKKQEFNKRIRDLMQKIEVAKTLKEQNFDALKSVLSNVERINIQPEDLPIIMENNNAVELESLNYNFSKIESDLLSLREMDDKKYSQYQETIYSISSKIAYWNTLLSKYI